MNKLFITIFILSIAFSSCRKWEVEGSIDNEDFAGEWIAEYSGSEADVIYVIKKSGNGYIVSHSPSFLFKTISTSKKPAKFEIKDSTFTIETKPNLLNAAIDKSSRDGYIFESKIVLFPTPVDTIIKLKYLKLDKEVEKHVSAIFKEGSLTNGAKSYYKIK